VSTTVFVVGRVKGGGFPDVIWDLVGVFASPKKANNACTNANDCVMPMILDECAPDEPTLHPGCYYPNA